MQRTLTDSSKTLAYALAGGVVLFALSAGEAVHAQAIMRTPTISVPSRAPVVNIPAVSAPVRAATVTSTTTARMTPVLSGGVTGVSRTPTLTPSIAPRLAARTVLPYVRHSPNLYPPCGGASRDPAGECAEDNTGVNHGSGNPARRSAGKASRNPVRGATGTRSSSDEIVAEFVSNLSPAEADAMGLRFGLTRLASESFPLIGTTVGLFRITDGRSFESVRREFAAADGVRSVQRNLRYLLQDQKPGVLSEGDPAQYALAKLRLPEAHTLVRGANVTVAVIDSGIDGRHPELANSIADNFDALESKEGPHFHGTGIAGAIVSHARLMGSAPEARIIAIRAFGGPADVAESSSYVILRSLNYAAEHGAQIVNMSFAGPRDAIVERAIAATAARGLVLVAAAGNAGPKSPPLYPAANPNVIAVSATDDKDKLFSASNRGNFIAVAAPGVDIFLPAPDGKYQVTSGTSFAAAYISGVAALLLERNSALTPEAVRRKLSATARDLGATGRDDLFGDGEADAYAAVLAVEPAAPLGTASATTKREDASERRDETETRALDQSSLSGTIGKSTITQVDRPAAQ